MIDFIRGGTIGCCTALFWSRYDFAGERWSWVDCILIGVGLNPSGGEPGAVCKKVRIVRSSNKWSIEMQ